MSQKSGFLIVLNGFFYKKCGTHIDENYNGTCTYWLLPPNFYSKNCLRVISALRGNPPLRS